MTAIFDIWLGLLPWLAGLAVLFTVLARLVPCNAQPLLRRDMAADLVYYFVMPVLNRVAQVVFLGAAIALFFRGQNYFEYGYGPLAELPLWAQAALVFFLTDFMLYWLHRWFHGRAMWRFHAVHHSSSQVDWLSTYRFHPVNSWLSFALTDATMLILGFSPAAVALLAGFNMAYSAMVHANLSWTFGPFKYLFASPVFHRWHHTAQEEGMDKNFAPTLPLLDVIFGTFYMPEGKRPQRYGVPGSDIPSGFLGQMLWPFKEKSDR